MEFKDKQIGLLEKIKDVELKIQDIYCTGNFEKANEIKTSLNRVKVILKNGYEGLNETGGFFPVTEDPETIVQKEMSEIEMNIEEFFKRTNVEENIELDMSRTTNEMLEDLRKINDDWNKTRQINSDIKNQEWDRKVTKTFVGIMIEKAKNGDEIDLGIAHEYCNTQDLLFVIKDKLISRAQKEDIDEAEKMDYLKTAKNLSLVNMHYNSLWQRLTGISNVKVTGKIEERPEESHALVVSKEKKGMIATIKERLGIISRPKTTVYTFADVNPYTFEWENVSTIISEFPKKLSKKQEQRLRGIEINDVPIVTQNDGLGKYPVLEKVTFGRNVKSIGKGVLSYVSDIENIRNIIKPGVSEVATRNNDEYGGWSLMKLDQLKRALKGKKIMYYSSVREVLISDDVENIAVEAFAYLPELMKIHFGARIHEIPSKCCAGCNLLEEIKFSKDTESIGTAAFCKVDEYKRAKFEIITSNIKKAKYYMYTATDSSNEDVMKYRECKQYNRLVELPSSIKKLGELAFGGDYADIPYQFDRLDPRYELLVSNKQWNEFKDAFKGSGRKIRVKFSDSAKPEKRVEFRDLDTMNKIEELHLAKHSPCHDWTRSSEKIYIANSNNSGTGEARKKDTDIKQIGDITQMVDNDEKPSREYKRTER